MVLLLAAVRAPGSADFKCQPGLVHYLCFCCPALSQVGLGGQTLNFELGTLRAGRPTHLTAQYRS